MMTDRVTKTLAPSPTVQTYINLTFFVESILLIKENAIKHAQEVMKLQLDVFYLLYLEAALWNIFLTSQKETS